MTSRTKRRLAVLALALGLIAAAPYLFRSFVDGRPNYRFGLFPYIVTVHGFPTEDRITLRVLQASAGPLTANFNSSGRHAVFVWTFWRKQLRQRAYPIPGEFITLRVACAVALAATWLLVLGGRLLAQRWTRRNAPSVGV